MRPRLAAKGLAAGVLATVVLAAGVLAAGCLEFPPYTPEQLIMSTEDATGTTVASTKFASTHFALHFAGGDGFHFPDTLTIDSTDVMGHEMMPSCSALNESGVLIAPAGRISANGSFMLEKNQLVPVLHGPAIAQVELTWATKFVSACSTTHAPYGTSTFTVFPDGRIVRHDTIGDPDSSRIDATNCGCNGGTDFQLATYWTLAKATFQRLYTPRLLESQMLPGPGDGEPNNNWNNACLDNGPGGAYQVAFAWHNPTDDPMDTMKSVAQNVVIHGDDEQIEFRRNAGAPVQVLNSLSLDDHSAIFIGHDDCVAEVARAKQYITPPNLMINGSSMPPAPSNGIYGGDDGSDGRPGFALGTDRATLVGPVDSPFAVWLRFPHAVDTIRATHAGSTGAWYVPQRNDDGSWIVWFPDPLKDSEPVTIEPH